MSMFEPPKRRGRPPKEYEMSIQSEAPKVRLEDTEEFKTAVAKALAAKEVDVKAMIAEAVKAELNAVKAPVTSAGDAFTMNDVVKLFGSMAMNIAEVAGQGNPKPIVEPAVMQQRMEGHKRMVDLIEQAHRDGLRPQYKAVAQLYLNDRFIEPYTRDERTKKAIQTKFHWSGAPSLSMRPVNDIAKLIYAAFQTSISSVEKIEGQPEKPMWFTHNGLMIAGDPPISMGRIGERRDERDDTRVRFNEALDVERAYEEPEDDEDTPPSERRNVNVLGTIHTPARQNFEGRNR